MRAARAVDDGHIATVTGFRTGRVGRDDGGRVMLESVDGRHLDPVDEVVVLTGFRPDLSFLSEGAPRPGPGVAGPRGAGAADRRQRALLRRRLPRTGRPSWPSPSRTCTWPG